MEGSADLDRRLRNRLRTREFLSFANIRSQMYYGEGMIGCPDLAMRKSIGISWTEFSVETQRWIPGAKFRVLNWCLKVLEFGESREKRSLPMSEMPATSKRGEE